MKKKILSFIFFLSFLSINGQNKVTFFYDQSGNRIERSIVMTKSAGATTTTPKILTDKINERIIKIFPNPTEGQIKVEIPENDGIKTCTLIINAMSNGRQIIKKKAILPITDIDISNQPNGVYIMIINIDGEITSWKIIKK